MTTYELVLQIVGIIIVLTLAWIIGTYNYLKHLSQKIDKYYSMLNTKLLECFNLMKMMLDLTVKYAKPESDTKIKTIEARIKHGNIIDKTNAELDIKKIIANLILLEKSYPKKLIASEEYVKTQRKIETCGQNLQISKYKYNYYVFLLNKRITSFPFQKLSKLFGYTEVEYFFNETEKKYFLYH